MTEQEAIEIIEDVTWQDGGRHYGKVAEARKMAIQALETRIPKRPLRQQGVPVFGYCPNCGAAIYKWLSKLACKECLQRLIWDEE